MIRIEIVGETIADFRQKLEMIFWSLSGRDQPTVAHAPDPILPEGMVSIPMEKPVEPKPIRRRATKGAGSEPAIVGPNVQCAEFPAEKESEQQPEVTAAQVRESLLALLQIGDDEPETILAAFQVKKISLLKPEEFAAVKAAADKRLKEWQDAK